MTSETLGRTATDPGAPLDVGPGGPASGGVVRQRRARRPVLSQLLLTLALLGFLAPLGWMVLSSLKTSGEIFSTPPTLFGQRLRFDNYTDALRDRKSVV